MKPLPALSLASLALAALVPLCPAQTKSAPPPARPAEAVHTQVLSADFADEPLHLESVGLTFKAPLDATIQTSQAGPATTIQLIGPDSTWRIVVSTSRVSPAAPSPTKWLDRTLLDVMSASSIKDQRTGETIAVKGQITGRTPNFAVPGSSAGAAPLPAERAYITLPGGASGAGATVRRGYTVFQPTADSFCIFELLCADAAFTAGAQRIYELTIATAHFSDPARLADSRRTAVLTGAAFLSGLTPASFDAAVAPDTASPADTTHWFRIFRPAATGAPADAQEAGFRSIRFFKGTLAQIDPKAASPTPGPANPEGYLVEIGARQLQRSAGPSATPGEQATLQVYDIRGIYFVSADRARELWSISTAIRDGSSKAPSIFTETGTRDGKQMTILLNVPGQPSRTIRPTVPPEGYLNQAEVFLLPRLAVAAETEGELGFYAYHTASGAVVLRRDTISKDVSPGGVWKVISRQTEGSDPVETLLDTSGRTLRGIWPDGLAIEPMPLEEIERLWKSKGLPTGSLDR
ncbi:MAG: hypothetical protein ACKVS8_04035 [Phycisphaerales bacterium]